jgi:hypothetical protein
MASGGQLPQIPSPRVSFYGFYQFGRAFLAGFHFLERHCQRLLDLRLEAKVMDSPGWRGSHDSRLIFHARIDHVSGVPADHVRRLVADETLLTRSIQPFGQKSMLAEHQGNRLEIQWLVDRPVNAQFYQFKKNIRRILPQQPGQLCDR